VDLLSQTSLLPPMQLPNFNINGFTHELVEPMGDSLNPSGPKPFVLPDLPIGGIALWQGSIASIPSGWALCDGTQGTPDLRDRFVQGAGLTHAVDATGGVTQHRHNFTGDSHFHNTTSGTVFSPGGTIASQTSANPTTGLSDLTASPPPFYSLAYIQRIA